MLSWVWSCVLVLLMSLLRVGFCFFGIDFICFMKLVSLLLGLM